MSIAIVWLRQDLRLSDNPALLAAADCDQVVPVWIDEAVQRDAPEHRLGAASRAWKHRSLLEFSQALAKAGTRLLLAQGEPLAVLRQLIEALGAESDEAVRVFWNRRYDPDGIACDKAVKQALAAHEPKTFNAQLLHEPWQVLKKDGTPYRVYTPYWRVVAARLDADDETASMAPLASPSMLPGGWQQDAGLLDRLADAGFSSDIESSALLPDHAWAGELLDRWPIGEVAAQQRLKAFLGQAVHGYHDGRDLPGEDGTSRLSPHLHHGELSPRQALSALCAGRAIAALDEGETVFAKELVWREFGAAMLYHFPDTLHEPLDQRFQRFTWREDADDDLIAWQCGRTGVPFVDAGMRQLYATGWMHNRVRMVVASYLIKNLLVDWREGEAWFRDTLVDADLASNTLGWQWAAGCGADAAPFFRVFNPVLQGEKFDRDGSYVRHWVPELARLGRSHLHKPWELPLAERVKLDYPAPLVDLRVSRQRALDAFAELKRG